MIADAYAYYGSYPGISGHTLMDKHQAWRDHFDPAGNRGMKSGLSWKFTNKDQAEQLITLALLKWGERDVA